jgi:predicted MFS family arabinose efflux permease
MPTDPAPAARPAAAAPGMSRWMVFLLATACGLIVANIYYAQPLIALIAPEIGLRDSAAGLIVTLAQVGYCAGLLLLVPLGDLMENRRLIVCTVVGVVLALLAAALARSAPWFLAASLAIGVGTVAVQMLVPMAAHLSPESTRGRSVGQVMSGLLSGIMLARPVASLVGGSFGWRTLFAASAAVMALLALLLWRRLPQRRPVADHGYAELMGSLWSLLRDTPALRRRAAYQAALFAAFSLYWTAVPLVLAGPRFGLSQHGIALFALAGVAGAFAAPIAGRLADQGRTRIATGVSLAMVALSFVLAKIGGDHSLALLVAAGIVLDLGVQANLVLGQRTIFALGAHVRSRLNALYMAIFFFGGAVGSSIASIAFTRGGWTLVSAVGLAFPVAALLYYATEGRGQGGAGR